MRYPAFVIVGTPRSGTTLVQRLACELDGVRVPAETHFFTEFVWSAGPRWRFPLTGDGVRRVLDEYGARPYLRDVPFDRAVALQELESRCDSLVDLFAGLVAGLAGSAGPAAVVGEKTPGHALWWRPLARALPELKVIFVVRDPRAVVASALALGWSKHHAMTAQRWNDDVRRAEVARRSLGNRCLVLRYEDVVGDESGSRRSIGDFLGARPPGTGRSAPAPAAGPSGPGGVPLFPAWEAWKTSALGPVDPDRLDSWRRQLSAAQQRDVDAICHDPMVRWGYREAGCRVALVHQLVLSPPAQLRRMQHQVRRARRGSGIRRLSRLWSPVATTAPGAPSPVE